MTLLVDLVLAGETEQIERHRFLARELDYFVRRVPAAGVLSTPS